MTYETDEARAVSSPSLVVVAGARAAHQRRDVREAARAGAPADEDDEYAPTPDTARLLSRYRLAFADA